MQATQNGSDLWLSYWVSHEHKQRLRLAGPGELGGVHMHSVLSGQPGPICAQTSTLLGSTWAWYGNRIPFRRLGICVCPVEFMLHLLPQDMA